MKPALSVVPAAAPPFDEKKGRKRVEMLKAQLLRAAVRYVREGTTGTPKDRLREASDLSGVPRSLIEVEIGK